MKRLFWSMVLIAITLSGGWGLYVSAQDLQRQIDPILTDTPTPQRYQFTEHFFSQQGRAFEIFLRLDRFTGQTWRFHASQPGWTLVGETAEDAPEAANEDRYELMSHVYRDSLGAERELVIRVDYKAGRTWRYQGVAATWEELEVEAPPQPDYAIPAGAEGSAEAPSADAQDDEDIQSPTGDAGL